MTESTQPPSDRTSPGDRDPTCRVQRLRIYPLKGGAGFDVERMDFDEIGPVGDRRWMVVRPDGTFITQREEPRLATVEARPEDGGLALSATGAPALSVPTPSEAGFQVRVWTSTVDAAAAGPAADAWLTDYLGYEVRLAYMPSTSVRATNPDFAPGARVSFADGYPALLVTASAVEEVSRRSGVNLELERFRPNIVVGPERAHAEDRWRQLTIGTLPFRGAKLCARCSVTTVDQAAGRRHAQGEPLRTLARYRNIEGKVFFGLNVVHGERGSISVGDAVHVIERGAVATG